MLGSVLRTIQKLIFQQPSQRDNGWRLGIAVLQRKTFQMKVNPYGW